MIDANCWRKYRNELGLLLAIVAVVLAFTLMFNRDYLTSSGNDVQDILQQTALLGISALGAAIVIIAGGIDLSSGSVIAFSGSVCGPGAAGAGAGGRRRHPRPTSSWRRLGSLAAAIAATLGASASDRHAARLADHRRWLAAVRGHAGHTRRPAEPRQGAGEFGGEQGNVTRAAATTGSGSTRRSISCRRCRSTALSCRFRLASAAHRDHDAVIGGVVLMSRTVAGVTSMPWAATKRPRD